MSPMIEGLAVLGTIGVLVVLVGVQVLLLVAFMCSR